jgi:hypothetical protein
MLLSFTRQGGLPMGEGGSEAAGAPGQRHRCRHSVGGGGTVRRRPHADDGRAVLLEITEAGRAAAAEATRLLNRRLFGSPQMNSPRMRALVEILRDVRREAGDIEE